MIKIKIFTDFCTTNEATNKYNNILGLCNNKYKNKFEFVTNNDYSHAIIINCPMPKLTIPKENVIGLFHEPVGIQHIVNNDFWLILKDKFIKYVKKYVKLYIIPQYAEILNKPFTNYYPFLWHDNERHNYNKSRIKKHIMSIIVSEKMFYTGHKYRFVLIKRIIESNMDIHIYGKGCKCIHPYKPDPRLKGIFKDKEPYENYLYQIVIENNQQVNYITEKYTNCLCYNTIPIYWGGININKYFGNNCCYILEKNIQNDFNKIKEIYNNPKKYMLDVKNAKKELFFGKCYLPNLICKEFQL